MAKPTTQYNTPSKTPTTFRRYRPVSSGLLLIGEGAFLLVEEEVALGLTVSSGAKPDTSFDRVSKPATAMAVLDKPETAWGVGAGLDGVRLDDMEVTLDDMDLFLTGYYVYPTPNTLSTKNPTEYQGV